MTANNGTAPQDDNLLGLETLIFSGLLVVSILGSYVTIRSRCSLLPESSVAIVIGAAFGAVLRWSAPDSHFWYFEPDVFFYVLLPPIIFEAGYTLKRRYFLDNLAPILTFAVLGTLISTAVVTAILVLGGSLGWMHKGTLDLGDSPLQSMQFAALISAVDPVATLAVLSSAEVNADYVLQSILFGESVLNDAVSIVLFEVLATASVTNISASLGSIALQFVTISAASTLIGMGVALLLSLVLRHTTFYEQAVHLEIVLTLCAAYVAYATAEALGYSGVLSLFFCGVLLGHYNWYNLSAAGKLVTGHVCKCLAYLSETLVFAYLGLSLFSPETWADLDWGFAGLAGAGCLLGRLVNVFALSALLNATRKPQITLRMQAFLWFAGLRGAIAYALAQRFPPDSQPAVVSTTMLLVLATTLGLGGLSAPVVRALGLTATDSASRASGGGGGGGGAALRRVSSEGSDAAAAAAQPLMGVVAADAADAGGDDGDEAGWMRRGWRHLDRDYLQPLFGGSARPSPSPRAWRSLRSSGWPLSSASQASAAISRTASAHERAQQLTRGGRGGRGGSCGGSGGIGGGSAAEGSAAGGSGLLSSRAGSRVGGSWGGGCGQAGGGSYGPGGDDAPAEREAAAERDVADEIFWLIRRGTNDPFAAAPPRRVSESGLDVPPDTPPTRAQSWHEPLLRALRGEAPARASE
eukprot:Transcript_10407.p1 GENE.Transcript_10407~~Transcript_10407.p1  ORF type:complete len:694 (-),score=239.82 Transcript_10407:94-2175(-)